MAAAVNPPGSFNINCFITAHTMLVCRRQVCLLIWAYSMMVKTMMLKEDGTLMDVNPNLVAFKAGMAPGMKIVFVNGRGWSSDVLQEAIASSKNSTSAIELVVENGSFHETYKLNYHGGARYPHLERDNSKPDVIGDVIKSRAR